MFRASSSHVWSPVPRPATLLARPARSGCTINGTIREATRLRSGWFAGIWLFGNGSRTGMPLTSRVVVRIEDLPVEERPAERVGADLAAGQQRAEVAVLERVDRRRVAEAGNRARPDPRVVEVREEERAVPAVVPRENERTAQREAGIVVARSASSRCRSARRRSCWRSARRRRGSGRRCRGSRSCPTCSCTR